MNHWDIAYIISAEKLGLNDSDNDARLEKLEHDLFQLGARFKTVTSYSQGVKENSLVVQGLIKSKVVDLMKKYERMGALQLDSSRHATFIQSNGETVNLGQFKAVSENEALKGSSYTFDTATNQYFVIK